VSLDEKGKIVGPNDVAAQVRQAYANVAEVLAKFGATMDDVVDETLFVTDIAAVMGNAEEVFRVRAEAYGGEPQVSQTLVQVAALVMPELMVEIKCVAYV
jgi:2-iminobutanoate/2-iminopropanoate deaminase